MTATLRDRQRALTRDLILDALISLLCEGRIHDFSVQAVADAAGVSHRTVYRHYPTREALLEGLMERLNRDFAETLGYSGGLGPETRLSVDDLPAVTETALGIFERHADLVRAYLALQYGAQLTSPERSARTHAFRRIVAPATDHLAEPRDRDAVAAVMRLLCSSVSWAHLRDVGEVPVDAAARTSRWVTETLLAALARGEGPGVPTAPDHSSNPTPRGDS